MFYSYQRLVHFGRPFMHLNRGGQKSNNTVTRERKAGIKIYVNAASGYIFRVSKGFHRSKQIFIKFEIRKVGYWFNFRGREANLLSHDTVLSQMCPETGWPWNKVACP